MKLDEALKALDENPKKVFGCVGMRLRAVSGAYKFENVITGKRDFGIGIYNDWQEVKQPVTWQEAIEAWADGKKIRCKCEGGETFFRPSNVSSACFTAKLITHGTWYIEEDTK